LKSFLKMGCRPSRNSRGISRVPGVSRLYGNSRLSGVPYTAGISTNVTTDTIYETSETRHEPNESNEPNEPSSGLTAGTVGTTGHTFGHTIGQTIGQTIGHTRRWRYHGPLHEYDVASLETIAKLCDRKLCVDGFPLVHVLGYPMAPVGFVSYVVTNDMPSVTLPVTATAALSTNTVSNMTSVSSNTLFHTYPQNESDDETQVEAIPPVVKTIVVLDICVCPDSRGRGLGSLLLALLCLEKKSQRLKTTKSSAGFFTRNGFSTLNIEGETVDMYRTFDIEQGFNALSFAVRYGIE
jgi:hypothetical protein